MVLATLFLTSCHGSGAGPAPSPAAEEATAILSDLRARFVVNSVAPPEAGGARPPRAPVFLPGLADSFQPHAGGLRPHFASSTAKLEARVTFPDRAMAPLQFEDVASGAAIDVLLQGARDVASRTADGYVIYPRAHASGATVLHHALPSGTEDFLTFEERPSVPEVTYRVSLRQGVRGLRLVYNSLELVDAGGAPRLRVTPPYVVGADGVRTDAVLAVVGCAVDTNTAAPWGREVTPPGAESCTVRVSWDDKAVVYPAVLDPRWTSTASMAVERQEHTATLLSNGKVLVAGGRSGTATTALSSAELYDRISGTWSTAGNIQSPTGTNTPTRLHTAVQLGTTTSSTTTGRVLVAGGINGSTTVTTTSLYDVGMNTWAGGTSMPAGRSEHTATVLANNNVVVIGGVSSGTVRNTAAIYNPSSGSGTWTSVAATMSSARRGHTATLLVVPGNTTLNNKILVVGGNNGASPAVSVNTWQVFDGVSAWTAAAALPVPSGQTIATREGHTATALANGNVLITGGKSVSSTATTYLQTAQLFNAATGAGNWSTAAGTMVSKRVGHTATLLPTGVVTGGKSVLLVGGSTNGSDTLPSTEVWDGGTGWTTSTDLTAATPTALGAVKGHTATLLGSNLVLIAGGVNGTTPVKTAGLFDPSLGVACTTNSQCAAGFCVSGVCCDTACNGGCGSCNLTGKVGTCSAVGSGTTCPDDGFVCTSDACDGTSVACQHVQGGGVCAGNQTITYYQSYDHGTTLDIAAVPGSEIEVHGAGAYQIDHAPGLFGLGQDSTTYPWLAYGSNDSTRFDVALWKSGSISAWIKPGSGFAGTQIMSIYEGNAGYNLFFIADGTQGLIYADAYRAPTDNHFMGRASLGWTPDNNWHLVVLNFSRKGFNISVDGSPPALAYAPIPELATIPISTTAGYGINPMSSGSPHVKDEVMIMNRQLGADEIAWYYNQAPRVVPNPAIAKFGPDDPGRRITSDVAFVQATNTLKVKVDLTELFSLTGLTGVGLQVVKTSDNSVVATSEITTWPSSLAQTDWALPALADYTNPASPYNYTLKVTLKGMPAAFVNSYPFVYHLPPVTPRFDGVVDVGGGQFKAIFGYKNTGSADVVLMPGLGSNYFVRNNAQDVNANPAPPTRFVVGQHFGSFQPVMVAGDTLSWTVAGQTVLAPNPTTLTPLPHIASPGGGYGVDVPDPNGGPPIRVVVVADTAPYLATPTDPAPPSPKGPDLGPAFNGVMNGQLSVSPSGAAVYTVPIAIPPGIGGMAPNLSLVYNSQGGNGIAGQGWELGGLSMIYRCPKTSVQDGESKPVTMNGDVYYDISDGVCLDGKRLFLASPSQVNGGYQFRSEQQDFSEISLSPDGKTFKIISTSGEIRLFGSSAASRVDLPGNFQSDGQPNGTVTAVWAIDTVMDTWGNAFYFRYNNGLQNFTTDGLIVTKIDYTAHDSSHTPSGAVLDAQNSFNSVTFNYEDRLDDQGNPGDVRVVSFGTATLPKKKRLKSIQLTGGGGYHLSYKNPDGTLPSRLEKIQYCVNGVSPTTCLKELAFGWDGGGLTWQDAGDTPNYHYAPPVPLVSETEPRSNGTQFVDLDADGRADLIQSIQGVGQSHAWRNSGQGWVERPDWALPAGMFYADGTAAAILADVDGDGLVDLINGHSNVAPYPMEIWLNRTKTGGGWLPAPSLAANVPTWGVIDFSANDTVVDLNGDGLADLVHFVETNAGNVGLDAMEVRLGTGTGWLNATSQYAFGSWTVRGLGPKSLRDINRDGLPDLVLPSQDPSIFNVALNTNSPTQNSPNQPGGTVWKFSTFPITPDPSDNYPQFTDWVGGDLNGDGLYDKIASWPLFKMGPPPGAQACTTPGPAPPGPIIPPLFPPCIRIYNGSMGRVALATGNGYTTTPGSAYASALAQPPTNHNFNFGFADLNGDGLLDLVKDSLPWVNTGSEWRLAANAESLPFVPGKVTVLLQGTDGSVQAQDRGENGGAFVDLDGDGIRDIVVSNGTISKAWLNRFKPPAIINFPNGLAQPTDVLYQVTATAAAQSPAAGQTSATYEDDGATSPLAPQTRFLSLPMRVVASVSADNGTQTKTKRTYSYRNLRASAVGRGPQGFAEIVVTDPPDTSASHPSPSITTTTYAQAYPYTGLPKVTVIDKSQGHVSVKSTTYCDTAFEVNGSPPCTSMLGTPAGPSSQPKASVFVYPISINEISFLRTSTVPEALASEYVVTNTQFRYDPTFGTLTSSTTDSKNVGGEVNEEYSFATVNEYMGVGARAQPALRTKTTVTTTKISPSDGTTPTIHTTAFNYAIVTKPDAWVSFTGQAPLALTKKIVEPTAAVGIRLDTAYDYDAFGNVITTTDCANDFSHCAAGATSTMSPPFRTSTAIYGAGSSGPQLPYQKGRFIYRSTNALGQSEYRIYDPIYGRPVKTTGPNNISTCFTYDIFGRQATEVAHCGATTELTTSTNYYEDPSIPGQVISETRPPTGSPSWVVSDRLGRPVLKESFGFDGALIGVVSEYDTMGRVLRTSKPATASGPFYWTTNYYDQLGRLEGVVQDLGIIDATPNSAATSTAIVYQGSLTITTETGPQISRSRKERKNLLGKVAWVEDTASNRITYTYDVDGHLIQTEDPAHNKVTAHYDPLSGRKDLSTDPDMGQWTYVYNGFGEMTCQTDAKAQVTRMDYDLLGRMVTKMTDAGSCTGTPKVGAGVAQWVYDIAPGAGVGKLAAVIGAADSRLSGTCTIPMTTLTGGNRAGRSFSYTAFGEVATSTECADGTTSVTQYQYDSFGRQSVVTYPQIAGSPQLSVGYHYTNLGYLHYLADDGVPNSVYWKATAMNALGQVTAEYTRNGVETLANRNPSTGWLMGSTSTAHAENDTVIQNWGYRYDAGGSLRGRSRTDKVNTADSDEIFTYDSLDRLKTSEVKIPSQNGYDVTETYDYDSLGLGNLTQKGAKTYSYTGCMAGTPGMAGTRAAGPHAVCGVTGSALFKYDLNGNMIDSGDRRIDYDATNKVIHIDSHPTPTQGNDTGVVDFIYGADGNRVVQIASGGPTSSARTLYVGMGGTGKSLYERTTRGDGTTEHVQFIYAGGAHGGNALALRFVGATSSATAPPVLKYYHFDHLGSVTAMSDETGHVVGGGSGPNAGTLGYDPWGGRRKPEGTAAASASFTLQPGHREFTGHEAIPNVGLVNMNGRVYDPALGRFLSPDPNIQFPTNLQSYNRYSYVLNNPLRYTDPTGYFLGISDAHFVQGLVVIIGAVACATTGPAGCMAFSAAMIMINAIEQLDAGASWGQVIATAGISLAASQIGADLGVELLGQTNLGTLVGAGIGGALSGAMTTPEGGDIGQNMLQGAAMAMASSAASMALQGQNPISLKRASVNRGAQGGSPSESPNCNQQCKAAIDKALRGNPVANSATGSVYFELTGETGEGEYEGLPKAKFRQWVVDRVQPIFDAFHVDYDVASTEIYVGGSQSHSPDFGVIQLATPGEDPGGSFARTGRSILHELGHQAQMATAGGYEPFMATWRAERDKYGRSGMYEVRGSVEFEADQFANMYLPRLLR